MFAQLTLAHPAHPPPRSVGASVQFAIGLTATRRHPGLQDLVSTVAHAIRAGEERFRWRAIEPAESRDKPPAHDEPPAPTDDPGPTDGPPGPDFVACMREADHHLELVPWIDLGADFDHAACLDEARQLLAHFAEHQSGTKGEYAAGWKSLALRARAGELHHQGFDYRQQEGSPDECAYTELAARCPNILAFLDGIVDLERTTNVRLMLLEGGGRIPVHTDDLVRPVVHSVNVAFNMPAGCEFSIDLAPDGKHTPYTRRAPFRDGTALLLNVAAFHAVEHHGHEDRIHLKIDGPLRRTSPELVDLARRQNGLEGRALYEALVEKYRALGWSIDRSPTLREALAAHGLDAPGAMS